MRQNLNIAAAVILLSIFCAICAHGEEAPKVNVNNATLDELAYLPGVGPAKASAIVDARPYTAIDELTRAQGIGTKTLAKLAPYLTAGDGPTTATVKIRIPADPVVITHDEDVTVKVSCDSAGCTVRLTGSLDSDSITVRTRG